MQNIKIGDTLIVCIPNEFCKGEVYSGEGSKKKGSFHQLVDFELKDGDTVTVVNVSPRSVTVVDADGVQFSAIKSLAEELFKTQ